MIMALGLISILLIFFILLAPYENTVDSVFILSNGFIAVIEGIVALLLIDVYCGMSAGVRLIALSRVATQDGVSISQQI